MAKKPRRRKSSIRSASKLQERELLAAAEALYQDPSPIKPRCTHWSLFGCVGSEAKDVEKVFAARDDEAKLQGFLRKGGKIARAYAATLLLRHHGEAPYLAQMRTPRGMVAYALRRGAAPEELVGVQYSEDPVLRLVAVLRHAKRGKTIYSLEKGGLVCAGRSGAPPAEFVAEAADRLGLARKGDEIVCEHEPGPADAALLLGWKKAPSLRICEACLDDTNTLHELAERIAAKKALARFTVEAVLPPLAAGAPGVTPPEIEIPGLGGLAEEYKKGTLSDAKFLEEAHGRRTAGIRKLPGLHLAAGDRYFGQDVERFVEHLKPEEAEGNALRAVLTKVSRPVAVERPTAGQVLRDLWPEHGPALLRAVAGDEATATRFATKDPPEHPGQLLAKVAAASRKARLEGELPRYASLPPVAAFADRLARLHRSAGRGPVLSELSSTKAPGMGALAYAFERSLGLGGTEWKYQPQEIDLGLQIQAVVETLMAASPAEYDGALRALSMAAGETRAFAPA